MRHRASIGVYDVDEGGPNIRDARLAHSPAPAMPTPSGVEAHHAEDRQSAVGHPPNDARRVSSRTGDGSDRSRRWHPRKQPFFELFQHSFARATGHRPSAAGSETPSRMIRTARRAKQIVPIATAGRRGRGHNSAHDYSRLSGRVRRIRRRRHPWPRDRRPRRRISRQQSRRSSASSFW